MRQSVIAVISLALIALTTPAFAFPALIIGIGAVAVAAVGISASHQPYEAWQYTEKYGWVGGAREQISALELPLPSRPGTSKQVVSACRDAPMRTAHRYDLVSLEAVSGGKPMRLSGRLIAPLDVRAIYKERGVHEVRRSKVRCEVDKAGRVVATT